MSDNWKEYANDPRTSCKYGMKCYQKNPSHHAAFKHPPIMNKGLKNRNNRKFQPYRRIEKLSPEKDVSGASTTEEEKIVRINTDDINVSDRKPQSNDITMKLPEKITYYDRNTDKNILKELFLVEMPKDFMEFFECLTDDDSIEKTLSSVNLELIGPYDLLLGKLPKLEDKDLYLIHWRFFYDPPEFQAVIKKKGKSQFHIGYYRDDPNEAPVFVASNDSEKNCMITPMASNLFGAIYVHLQNEKKRSPFTAMACQKVMNQLKKYADEHNISLEEHDRKKRTASIVTKTFHGAGIVVPYNKKTQLGYRRLVETDANIKKLFQKLEEAKTDEEKDKVLSDLQPVITYATIAVDECDFGTGLECGINLFCSGLKQLEPSALSCLSSAYTVLNRHTFKKIIQMHIKYRRRGENMSILNLQD